MKLNFNHDVESISDSVTIDGKILKEIIHKAGKEEFDKINSFINYLQKDDTIFFSTQNIAENIIKLIDVENRALYSYICGWELVACSSSLKYSLEISMALYSTLCHEIRISKYIESIYVTEQQNGLSEDVAASVALFTAGGVSQSINMFKMSRRPLNKIKKFFKKLIK